MLSSGEERRTSARLTTQHIVIIVTRYSRLAERKVVAPEWIMAKLGLTIKAFTVELVLEEGWPTSMSNLLPSWYNSAGTEAKSVCKIKLIARNSFVIRGCPVPGTPQDTRQ